MQAVGGGMIVSSGKRFQFEVANYSIKGLMVHVLKGTVPGIGEELKMTVRRERRGEPPARFTVTAQVVRLEKRKNRILCAIEVLDARDRQDATVMDHAYLEEYFESLI